MLQAKLVVVGGEAQSQEVTLKLPAVIGRGKEATLKVPLALISRRHCEIREREGRLYIRDLGSLNGTFVNNYKITAEQPLLPGELVTVGTITFRAEYKLQTPAAAQPDNSRAAQPTQARDQSSPTGTGSKPDKSESENTEAIVFTAVSSTKRKASDHVKPQFDSTVAGTMSVTVSPGQPVRIRENGTGATAQRPAAPSRSASVAPSAGNEKNTKQTKADQPADSGLVLDSFPLDVSPQKSISLSALDELDMAGPRQVSFIGNLSFGVQARPTVSEGVSIEVESGINPNDQPLKNGDSRLDSFLRAIEQPAD